MKCFLIVLTLSALSILTLVAQDTVPFKSDYSNMGRIALSLNYGGAVNFGPMLHAEPGLNRHLRLDTHVRFLKYGLAYQFYHSFTDVSAPPAPGFGILYCFGNHIHKPCVSVMGEYGYNRNEVWAQNDAWK